MSGSFINSASSNSSASSISNTVCLWQQVQEKVLDWQQDLLRAQPWERKILLETIMRGVGAETLISDQLIDTASLNGQPMSRYQEQEVTEEELVFLRKWRDQELQLGNIERVAWSTGIIISRLFTIPKSSGGWRVIHSLVQPNKYFIKRRFHMDTVSLVRKMWSGRPWGVKIDIKDAFRHLMLAQEIRNMFCFEIEGELFRMVALPFGWTLSPFYWNLVSDQIKRWMRELGIIGMVYVDDILILGNSKEQTDLQGRLLLLKLQAMGLSVNLAKSCLEAAQEVEFLGYIINLKAKTFSICKAKVAKIRHLAARELKATLTSRKRIARLLGTLQGAREALPWLDAMTSRTYRWMYVNSGSQNWRELTISWNCLKKEFRYWSSLKRWQATSHFVEDQEMLVRDTVIGSSDASTAGYSLSAKRMISGEQLFHIEGQ